jgi:hypothetical protein
MQMSQLSVGVGKELMNALSSASEGAPSNAMYVCDGLCWYGNGDIKCKQSFKAEVNECGFCFVVNAWMGM